VKLYFCLNSSNFTVLFISYIPSIGYAYFSIMVLLNSLFPNPSISILFGETTGGLTFNTYLSSFNGVGT